MAGIVLWFVPDGALQVNVPIVNRECKAANDVTHLCVVIKYLLMKLSGAYFLLEFKIMQYYFLKFFSFFPSNSVYDFAFK